MNRSQMRRVIIDHLISMDIWAWEAELVDVLAISRGQLIVIQWTKSWDSPQQKERFKFFLHMLISNGAFVIESDDPKEVELLISERLARAEILS